MKFCNALRDAYLRHPLGKEKIRHLPQGKKILQTTEDAVSGLMFYQIWAYSQYEEVPTGVLLIISYLLSKFEHLADDGDREIGTPEEASRAVDGLRALLQRFEELVSLDKVSDQHVRELLDAYRQGVKGM